MNTTKLSAETNQIIKRYDLGSPSQIYTPITLSNILSGSFMLCCAAALASIPFITGSTSPASNNPEAAIAFFIYFSAALLIVLGLRIIFRAISNRNQNVIICTHGVVYLQKPREECFRWEDVLTTRLLAIPRRGFTYTVHRRNGKSIVFEEISHMQDLAATIDIQVARTKER